jgi:imidazolonepropionase-like amidohydrolase
MKNLKYMIYQVVCLLVVMTNSLITLAQQVPVPAPAQSKKTLVMNGRAHLGNGQIIENSAIGFVDGKFTLVADATVIRMDMSAYDTIIDASGKEVYPGFIAPNSTLGLLEIDMVRQTSDLEETGTFRPSMRSIISYNTESEIIPTVRSNGVLMGQITPRGGVVSGTSSVVQFDAWNWEDAVVRLDDGVHLNWPSVFHKQYDKGSVRIEKVKSYEQQLREIQSFFSEAKAYCSQKELVLTEVRFEALRSIFEGNATLYVHAEDVKQITEALRFKNEMQISNMVIVGAYDAVLCSAALISNNVPVMLRRVHELPKYNEDDVDLPYKLPAQLYKLGVTFCFENSGDMERMGSRNIPFYAGTAVAYGLPYEEAVRSLSLNTAKILGIDKTCGSIEIGKDATLFISEGDALDMITNKLEHAWIQGRKIDLSNKQTRLYEKWKSKYDKK